MTTKDYIKFAGILAGEYACAGSNNAVKLSLRCVMLSMSDVFYADNPCFDRDRFYEACGIPRYTRLTP